MPEMDDGEGVKKLMYDNYGEMHDARVVLLKVKRIKYLVKDETGKTGKKRSSFTETPFRLEYTPPPAPPRKGCVTVGQITKANNK